MMNISRSIAFHCRKITVSAGKTQIASISRVPKGVKRRPVKVEENENNSLSVPPPAPLAVEDCWQAVTDKNTGQIYWWNTQTNETTALGAPKPNGPTAIAQPQESQPSMLGGFGRVVAEGFAFGTGSSIAHHMVGSFFNSGSDSSSSSSDDSFDI